MATTTNPFIRNYDWRGTQDLYQDLIIEAIKAYGMEVLYLPRTFVNEDDLLGEDTLSIFDDAIPIEMYPKEILQFGGEGDILTRFGITIKDEIHFTVSRRRFHQILTEKLVTEEGLNLTSEDSDRYDPSEADSLRNESTEYDYSTLPRPHEGDLIYIPLTNKVFQINYVEHEELFYQTGYLPTYELTCELWQYSSERVTTDLPEIDDIFANTIHTFDILDNELETEDGDILEPEANGSFISEDYKNQHDQFANNEMFEVKSQPVVNRDEKNPFERKRKR